MTSTRVKVEQGVVRGCEEQLPDGRSFLRFSGIPYAKKPINELRFRDPEKMEKFDETEIDCTKEGDPCLHRSIYLQEDVGSEDCLYLNVYVPSDSSSTEKLAVMIYIHGGGFSFDSGSIEWYSPEHLLMENVIVVTVNYRLHVLGFLCLPSKGIAGNAGLKDQQMALQWVHENISNFNGDPDNICLFGESAGGASVHLQTLNKKSRSFLKSAICQSGCALADWVVQYEGVDVSRKLAKFLGCKSDDDDEIYKTLMTATPQELFQLKVKPQHSDQKRRNLPFVFKPVVELESPNAFMTEPPAEMIKTQRDQINIPIMFGTTDIDGNVMVSTYKFMVKAFEEDPVRLLPRSIKIDPNSATAREQAEDIKRFYFGEAKIDETTIRQFINHMTDYHFLTPQTMSNELNALYQRNCKQFLYEFQFDGELNHYKMILQMGGIPGAGHADDVCYLFDQRPLNIKIDTNSRSHKMKKTMCKLWTNFAKYQNPTPEHDKTLPIKWTPVQPATTSNIDLDYLEINDVMKMTRNLNKSRMDYWRKVYRKWNGDYLKAKL